MPSLLGDRESGILPSLHRVRMFVNHFTNWVDIMRLGRFLQSLVFSSPNSNRRRKAAARASGSESLEQRALLTGNVVVQLTGPDAFLTGDADNNSVEIVALGMTVVVRGLSGTTINGGTTAFTLSAASTVFAGALTASLGGGDDVLSIGAGLTISGDVSLHGSAGNDSMGITGTTLGHDLRIVAGTGTNILSLQSATVARDVLLSSLGTATVNVSDSTVGGQLNLVTGRGADAIVVSGTTINGNTHIHSGRGNDDIVIRNSTLHRRLDVDAGAGTDILFVDATTVDRVTRIEMHRGADNVQIQSASNFHRRFVVLNGLGRDAVEVVPPATVHRLRTFSTRSRQVSDALIADRINHVTTGAIAKADAAAALFNPMLTVVVATDSVAENAGATATTMMVSRSGSTAAALDVILTSSNILKASVPGTVTIPVGSASVTVNIAAIDNTTFEADATVAITAAATGQISGTDTLIVTNDESAALTVTPVPTTALETAGASAVTFTVSRNTADISQALIVNLSSGTPGRLTVGSTVTIPANAASVTFVGAAVNNAVADGSAVVTVTASAAGLANGTASVTVTDDETATITASVSPTPVSEAVGTNASVLTVSRNTADDSAALIVTIGLSNSTRLSAPATITIPAGQASATATLSTINNATVDGNLVVTINVTATDFIAGSTTLTITEDDTAALALALPSSTVSESVGAIAATVSVNQVSTTDRTVNLTYSNAATLTGPASVTILAGQLSANLPLNVIDGSVFDGNVVVAVQAASTGVAGANFNLTVTDNDTMSLTTDISFNVFTESNGTVITRNALFRITGLTSAGAAVTVDSDGDGQYDDASTTAAGDGSYSVDVTLTNNATNHGENSLVVKAVLGADSADQFVAAHLAVGSVYHFTTNVGAYDVELLDTAAPITVLNFMTYADSTAYDNLIVHRSDSDFVIQGGGFTVSGGDVKSVTTNAAIQNEFNAANSNLRGTLSMALQGGQPSSGTSQWFVSTVNNSGLDAALHTVFGRVIGTGMTVIDQINNLTSRNLSTIYGISALNEVPLLNFNPANTQLTGTVATTSGSAVVTGTTTLFTTQLQVGDSLRIGNTLFFVQSIESDTSLTLKTNTASTASGLTAVFDVVPNDADFVIFSNISEILL